MIWQVLDKTLDLSYRASIVKLYLMDIKVYNNVVLYS